MAGGQTPSASLPAGQTGSKLFCPDSTSYFHSDRNSRPPQDKEHHCTQTELSTNKGPLPLFLCWGAGRGKSPQESCVREAGKSHSKMNLLSNSFTVKSQGMLEVKRSSAALTKQPVTSNNFLLVAAQAEAAATSLSLKAFSTAHQPHDGMNGMNGRSSCRSHAAGHPQRRWNL